MKNLLFTLILYASLGYSQTAPNIVKLEYWIDGDPGLGMATDISGISIDSIITSHSFLTSTQSLNSGVHYIGIRSKDSNDKWSQTNFVPFYISELGAPVTVPNISNIEYWIDGDPGFGSATGIIGFVSDTVINHFSSMTTTQNLTTGIHWIGIRSRDGNNKWGQTNFIPFYISDSTASSSINLIEYFWDGDMGLGSNLTHSNFPAFIDSANYMFLADVPVTLTVGNHNLFIRSRDSQNRWGHTNYWQTIYIDSSANVGIMKIHESDFSLFPNPFLNVLNLTTNQLQKIRFILYSERGQIIFDKIIDQSTQVNTEGLAKGKYIALIWAEKNKIYRSTLVKQ
jgi:hypothetical protein